MPWGAHKERSPYLPCVNIDMDIRPGEYVMRTLFADFTIQAEKKMETVMTEPPERPLSKVDEISCLIKIKFENAQIYFLKNS